MKKLLSLTLVVLMLLSTFMLTSCDAALEMLRDYLNAQTTPKEIRHTITQEEWVAVLNSTNFTLKTNVNTVMKTDTEIKVFTDDNVAYYILKDGIAYQGLQYHDEWVYTEIKDDGSFSAKLIDILIGWEEWDFFEMFTYNEESQSYVYEENGIKAEFYFENGKLVRGNMGETIVINNVGLTVVETPKFKTEPDNYKDTTSRPSGTTPPWDNTEPEPEPEPDPYEEYCYIDGFGFVLNEERTGYILYTYDSNLTNSHIEIPGYVNELPVIEIGELAFAINSSFTSVNIPNTVTKIGKQAFDGCNALTSIVIPDSVIIIEDMAFQLCKSLESVVLGDGVTTIGQEAFRDCYALKTIVFGKSLETIGRSAFTFCNSLSSVVIPDSVTAISAFAFYYCTSLSSVYIPDSVVSIGDSAFLTLAQQTDYYCEAETKPENWANIWANSDESIHWGYTGE